MLWISSKVSYWNVYSQSTVENINFSSKLFAQNEKSPENFVDRTDVFACAALSDGYSVSTCVSINYRKKIDSVFVLLLGTFFTLGLLQIIYWTTVVKR